MTHLRLDTATLCASAQLNESTKPELLPALRPVSGEWLFSGLVSEKGCRLPRNLLVYKASDNFT